MPERGIATDMSSPRPREAARRHPEAPKMPTRGSKRPPREPQEAPRRPQETPNRLPKASQEDRKLPLRGLQ
eukprot:7688558-Pyramimonas_sp.AAC.1